jgi:hypothetical protein
MGNVRSENAVIYVPVSTTKGNSYAFNSILTATQVSSTPQRTDI